MKAYRMNQADKPNRKNCLFFCKGLLDALAAELNAREGEGKYQVEDVEVGEGQDVGERVYRKTRKKDSFGGPVSFQVWEGNVGDRIYILKPFALGQRDLVRVARDDIDPSKWRIDRLGMLGTIWEALEDTRFDSAAAAARRLVERLTAELVNKGA